jgi:adenylate kinase family enzyme
MNAERLCIIGNSGSGKSTLARELAAWNNIPLLELDGYVWAAESPPRMRPDDDIARDINSFLAKHDRWIIEGCYAKWAALSLAFAPEMIFLDLPEETCLEHCKARPWQPEKFSSKSAQELTLPFLLDWVSDYYVRDDDMSRTQHDSLFERYGGPKRRIENVEALRALKPR